jgi:oligogalacturonide lyase
MSAHRWTRRRFVSSLTACAALGAQPRGQVFPSERFRYYDPATEFPVLRLTSPEYSSHLPAATQRAVSRRRSFLLFSSDRTGSPQLRQMFLTSGQSRLLTAAPGLDVLSATLAPDERNVFYFDGPSLRQLSLGTLRDREIYRVREGWERAPGFCVSPSGSSAVLVEAKAGVCCLRMIRLAAKPAEAFTVTEVSVPISDPLMRPRHEEVLYRYGTGALWLTGYDGRNSRALPLGPGRLGPAFWAADGEALDYLNLPGAAGQLNAIRECTPDTGGDRLIASTSQFATFAPNADQSVFIGASANTASPDVLLLLRVARRELTICEHRASDASRVRPIFSPDSQWIFFESDRHGKPAIYSVGLERLVERTEE